MPFEVFRRHQKKMLAVLAIFAMVAFTLDFSLFRNSGAVGPGINDVRYDLYGEPITEGEILRIKKQRLRANRFMQAFNPGIGPEAFGGVSDPEIQDALILEHEADRLKMPRSPDLAKLWLREITQGKLTPAIFDEIYRENFTQQDGYAVTDDQLLADLASQLRLAEVLGLPGGSTGAVDLSGITPLDLFESYRDQNERVSARLVAFPAEDFLDEVPEPTDAEVRAYYDRYKDALPDPDRETPGFRSPRTVDVEYVVIDQQTDEDRLERTLTTEEVRQHFKDNPDLFPEPVRDLPIDLFAGDKAAALTPDNTDPFTRVAPLVRQQLAFERAQEQANAAFEAIQTEVFDPFIDQVLDVQYRNDDAAELDKPLEPLPKPFRSPDQTLLNAYAVEHDLTHARTGPLTREAAETDLTLAGASIGSGMMGGRPFASYVFDASKSPYEPFEMGDMAGRRYLAWKLEDKAPETPPLVEIRDRVARAWKLEKARDLAKTAAEALAAKAREAGGALDGLGGLDRPVEVSSQVARSAPGSSDRLNPIPPITRPGPELRVAYFGLEPGQVVVEANAPKSIYYVMTLRDRTAADLQTLYGPVGLRPALESRVGQQSAQERSRLWLEYLREQAGVKPDPAEVAEESATSQTR